MSQKENPQAEDGQAFDEGTEPRGAGSWQPEDKIDTSGFKEGHQLGTFTLHLKETIIKTEKLMGRFQKHQCDELHNRTVSFFLKAVLACILSASSISTLQKAGWT